MIVIRIERMVNDGCVLLVAAMVVMEQMRKKERKKERKHPSLDGGNTSGIHMHISTPI